MSHSAEIPPTGRVAGSPPAPYTGVMPAERAASPLPWWKEAVRSWVPVLALAAILVFQMIGLQRQIGDLRTDIHREISDLHDDLRGEISDLRGEINDLRVDMGERITRLETLMEVRPGSAASRPGK